MMFLRRASLFQAVMQVLTTWQVMQEDTKDVSEFKKAA